MMKTTITKGHTLPGRRRSAGGTSAAMGTVPGAGPRPLCSGGAMIEGAAEAAQDSLPEQDKMTVNSRPAHTCGLASLRQCFVLALSGSFFNGEKGGLEV